MCRRKKIERLSPRPTLFVKGSDGYLYISLNDDDKSVLDFVKGFANQTKLFFKEEDGAMVSSLPFSTGVSESEINAKCGDVILNGRNELLICLKNGVFKGRLLSRTYCDEKNILTLSGEAVGYVEWSE